jgi:hypothetical protein
MTSNKSLMFKSGIINITFWSERSLAKKTLPMHEVVENLKSRIGEMPLGDPNFADLRYQPVNFSVENFHPIKISDSERTLCYVDGGNAQIACAPNFVVELARLNFCKFKGQDRMKSKSLPRSIEFYTVCCTIAEGYSIKYETEFVPVRDKWTKLLPDIADLKFDSFDDTLRIGRQRAPIERVSNSARTFAEWNLARHLISEELEEGDILVRDGSLQTVVTNESKYANRAYRAAMKKGVIFTGLSKTSSLFTTTGYPLLSSINELSESTPLKKGSWYYHPIVKITHPDHRAEMFAVKLHDISEYVFRFEILRDQFHDMSSKEMESVIGALAVNARDIGFPGYPYGLMEADRLARITGHERDSQEVQFMSASASAGIWDVLLKHVRCVDAHSILNKLAGE